MSEFSKKLKNEYDRARKAILNAKKTPLIGLCLSGVLFIYDSYFIIDEVNAI